MCGIAGILNLKHHFNEEHSSLKRRIQNMTDALEHRGPDAEAIWINPDGNISLGHRRLSIIDLSEAGNQPMHYLKRFSMVYNGEIYNYPELKEELQKKNYHFTSQSDSEVILAAYAEYGKDCVHHFDGMFAFAIWDEQEQNLFCARDRFGEKPFYYFCDEKEFLFASEMKALWAAGVVKNTNLQMLFNYITIGYVDNPNQPEETFYEGIEKLPPACTLIYVPTTNKLTIEKYWNLDINNENLTISDEDAIEQFQELFKKSVTLRYRSDVPVGTSLSGGLDSSSIIAFSQLINSSSNSHKAFSCIFPGFENDESVQSKIIADKYKLEQYTTTASATELISGFEKLMYHQEEPVGSASVFAQYQVYQKAAQQNVKVILDGQGADEILGGYHKYYKWYWQELFRNRELIGSNEIKTARSLGVTEKFGFKNILASLLPEFAVMFLENQFLLNTIRHPDLNKEYVRLNSKEAYYTSPAILKLNDILYFNTCTHGLEELLRYADRNSMAHGREVRLPFLNHELVQFAFSLPSKFKIREGRTKWLLRQTMKNELPDEIVWQTKKIGFEPPQKKWMQDPVLKDLIMTNKEKLVHERILKPNVLNKPIKASSAYEAENYDWRYLCAGHMFTPNP